MFPMRMGSEKPGSEVLQAACLKKEQPDRNKEGWKDALENMYCSYYDCPFKLSAKGKRNTSNFQYVDGHNICFRDVNVASTQ